MPSQRRAAFTLIEILIAVMLLGIGVTSTVALLAIAISRAQVITAWTTMGPVASGAVAYCAAHGKDGTTPVDLPDGTFASPYALRVDAVPAPGADASDGLGSIDGAHGAAGSIVTYRVRIYDTAENRDRDVRNLGTMFIRQYLRRRP
jgi:prepilin-type N-terminal cleavage/methylation domain-containing protein